MKIYHTETQADYDALMYELKSKKQKALKAEIERHNSKTREKMRDGSVATIAQASEYIDSELGLTLSTWHETWTKLPNWNL